MRAKYYFSSLPRFASRGRILGLGALLWGAGLARPAAAQTWMVSTNAYVRLGVLDKFGQLWAYEAKFVVHNVKTGKEYFLTQKVERGQNGADVYFPSEPTTGTAIPVYFKAATGEGAPATPGRYTWECQVNGKRAVSGWFTLPEVGNDVTVIEK